MTITFRNELTNDMGLIELQGKIEVESSIGGNVDVGSFYFDNGLPMLRVGNQLLTGSVKKLTKPYAIIEKEESNQYRIASIIREKYLFSTRPKAILHNELQ